MRRRELRGRETRRQRQRECEASIHNERKEEIKRKYKGCEGARMYAVVVEFVFPFSFVISFSRGCQGDFPVVAVVEVYYYYSTIARRIPSSPFSCSHPPFTLLDTRFLELSVRLFVRLICFFILAVLLLVILSQPTRSGYLVP